ncbi:hypothetical protein GUY44_11855 [Pimelobacter simplex]|uniref:Uncharacterized protein n=1 Tax=Nocardioides simplex TaxID=2045 RepID=A0A0A1DHM2_NOCSI|nr:hypothetical protein [Pimelobacter simplex]AIY16127.1 hypothetical protein KR76_03990 [Pimelobacter simplex]MCG8151176.1 hypothetical protein [Pimelobacter simplex]GEB17232.1 hypothetical protein NSI01_55470 [Pimelobacter simplex]SFM98328.1 hypothetical protein SAMN05421671_4533 [Pimelobacter simplex]
MTAAEDIRQALRELGKELETYDAARRVVLGKMGDAMRQGKGADLNIKEMAELAGVTRVTAYRLLEKAHSDGQPFPTVDNLTRGPGV